MWAPVPQATHASVSKERLPLPCPQSAPAPAPGPRLISTHAHLQLQLLSYLNRAHLILEALLRLDLSAGHLPNMRAGRVTHLNPPDTQSHPWSPSVGMP